MLLLMSKPLMTAVPPVGVYRPGEQVPNVILSSISISSVHVYTRFGVWCHWCFHYPGLLLHTELMVSLFIRCTMRCEIWAQPAELPW